MAEIINCFSDFKVVTSSTKCLHKNLNSYYCQDCGQNLCPHDNVCIAKTGIHMCTNCGTQLESLVSTQEWKYKNGNVDTNRYHTVKQKGKGVKAVFEKHNVNETDSNIEEVEKRYNIIIKEKGSVTRGKTRESLIVACLFSIYKERGQLRPLGRIAEMFNLELKRASSALSLYIKTFPETLTNDNESSIITLIPKTLEMVSIKDVDKYLDNIIEFANLIIEHSSIFKRSIPQSIAAAIIFFYLTEIAKKEVDKKEFAKNVNRSEITTSKLTQAIKEVVKT